MALRSKKSIAPLAQMPGLREMSREMSGRTRAAKNRHIDAALFFSAPRIVSRESLEKVFTAQKSNASMHKADGGHAVALVYVLRAGEPRAQGCGVRA